MTCTVKIVLLNIIAIYILNDCCTACEPRSNVCDIESWSNWSACNSTCGTGVQKREKRMCCQSQSLVTCLSTCNISNSWWQNHAVEFKTCGICKKGGVFDAIRNRCKCPIGFVGNCCNDFNVCGLRPCQHGSKCTTNGQGYSCICTQGYDGFNCQIDTVKTTVKPKTTTIPTMTATSEVTNTETPTTAAPTISVTQTSTLPSTIETSTISVTQTSTLPSTIETSTISVTQTGTLPSTIETSTISVTQTDTLPSTIETSTISVTQTGTLPSTIETSTISVTRTILLLPTNTTQTIDSIQRTASSTISFQTMTATIQAINASKSEITMPSTITINKATTVQNGTSTDATIQSSILPVTTITQNSKIPQTSISTTRTNHTASKPTPIVPSSSIISSTIKPNTKKRTDQHYT
ncbi:unnamed protein product [Mytilus edulis]|uniref:EGF-like domain-containing protein n=1 Tax=Mytilus edulis TaxID=6550 RepID=A0A8S3UHA2_MYTED|nr:unnamed protein product [Mytilus edulis]